MTFGKELKKIREERKLTQDVMAQTLEISLSSYSRIENDQIPNASKNMQKILVDEFFTEKERLVLKKEFKRMINAKTEEASLGSELRQIRMLKGLMVKEFAEKLGLNKSTYQGVESGKLSVNSGSARKVVESKGLTEEQRKKLRRYIPKQPKTSRKKSVGKDTKPEITKKQRMEYRRRKNIAYLRKEVDKPNPTRKKIKRAIPRSSTQKVLF